MKDYSNFTPVELAQDDDFIRWVESGPRDEALDRQWKAWLVRHPEKREVAEEARRIIDAIVNEKQYFMHDSKHQELWSRIENTVSQQKEESRFSRTTWYGIAAAVALLIVAGVALFQINRIALDVPALAETAGQASEQLLRYSNESNKPHALVLDDGSVVTLQPHSSLRYPETFPGVQRNVYLSGEAFFEVARDPHKPFSVHANEIVTRVLGTSFTVRAYEKERDVVVAVKTGKVSVFTEAERLSKGDSSQNQVGTLLTPNQQIVFSRDHARMVKSLVDEPASLPMAAANENFQFEDTPIREVFARLQKAYGVEIIFDEEVMSNCYLTTSLANDSFYDKLRLICKGINAKYEILDAHVIITGSGCK